MQPASVGFQCPECVREGARTVRTGRSVFGGDTAGERGLVTRVLLGINIAAYLLTVLAAVVAGAVLPVELGTFLSFGGRSPVTDAGAAITAFRYADGSLGGIAAGEVWRLVTAGFLHYGLLHLALNMYALWILGRECERLIGRWRFVALYLLSGIGGVVAELLFGGIGVLLVGASGSVFGLFGALFFFFRRMRSDVRGLVGLIAVNLALGFFIPNISVLGHLGGLVVGGVIGAVLAYAPRGQARTPVQVAGLAGTGLVLALLVVARTLQLGLV